MAGHGRKNRRRFIGEIEGAGNDVAIRRNHQPRRRTRTFANLAGARADNIGAAGGFDLHHAGSYLQDDRLHGLFVLCFHAGAGWADKYELANGNQASVPRRKRPKQRTMNNTPRTLNHFFAMLGGTANFNSMVVNLSPRRTSSLKVVPGPALSTISRNSLMLVIFSPLT